MSHKELDMLLQMVIRSPVSQTTEDEEDEFVDKLRFFFDDAMLLAALDLVDRDHVIHLVAPWGLSLYRVLGTTATYDVYLGNPTTQIRSPIYCSCPSFCYSVLLSGAQIMCKHILAIILAKRMAKCVERNVGPHELAVITQSQASPA